MGIVFGRPLKTVDRAENRMSVISIFFFQIHNSHDIQIYIDNQKWLIPSDMYSV